MNAMEKYQGVCAVVRGKEYWAFERSDVADAADAVIAELEALVDALTDEVSDERDLYDGAHARIAELGEQINADSEGLEEQKARIAELEAENEEWVGYFDACYTDMCHYKDRAVQAEATIERLKTALVAIQSTTPGSAHRIAIQALAERGTE